MGGSNSGVRRFVLIGLIAAVLLPVWAATATSGAGNEVSNSVQAEASAASPQVLSPNPDPGVTGNPLPNSGTSQDSGPTTTSIPPPPTTTAPGNSPSTSTATTEALTTSTGQAPATSSTIPPTSTTVPATTSTVPPTSTTVPATTTSTSPPTVTPPGSGVLWSANYETGDTSQWDGIWISGNAESQITSEIAHTGAYGNALTVYDANGSGSSPGVRMTYQGRGSTQKTDPANLPTAAYYSSWYYIPEHATVSWWNIFQWKTGYDDGSGRTARALYWHDLDDYGDELYLELQTRVNGDGEWVKGWSNTLAIAPVPIPIGQWFHLESYYVWDTSSNGRVTTWLDGVQMWDIGGLTTEFDWPYDVYKREWTVNNYANDTTPSTHTIYIDDAAVSFSRVGP